MSEQSGSTLVFDIPLPPRGCSVNDHRHRLAKVGDVKQYRMEAWVAAYRARMKAKLMKWPYAKAEILYEFHLRRTPGRYCPRDEDNALAAMKAAQDGFGDAGLYSSDDRKHVRVMRPTFAVERPAIGFVRVTVREAFLNVVGPF